MKANQFRSKMVTPNSIFLLFCMTFKFIWNIFFPIIQLFFRHSRSFSIQALMFLHTHFIRNTHFSPLFNSLFWMKYLYQIVKLQSAVSSGIPCVYLSLCIFVYCFQREYSRNEGYSFCGIWGYIWCKKCMWPPFWV